jgi:hypothetical protein
MKHTRTLALLGVTATAALAGAAPAMAGTPVSVRVEGKAKTLLGTKKITTATGWLTRYGAPKGACSAGSAAGALNTATRGHWGGTFDKDFGDYFITRILGEYESGTKVYWDIFVNNVAAKTGACGIKLHRGDQVLFAAVPSTGPVVHPLGLQGPSQARVGGTATVKVVSYDGQGRAKPFRGAQVSGSGVSATSNALGLVHIHISHTGTLFVKASKRDYVRSAALRIVELP